MADISLQAESACANPVHRIGPDGDFKSLFRAYNAAKVAFEAECLEPVEGPETNAISDAHTDALNAFMLSPAFSMQHLAEKLRVFQAEDLREWFTSEAIIATMVADAQRLADRTA